MWPPGSASTTDPKSRRVAHASGVELIFDIEYTIPLPVLGRLAAHFTVRRMERDFDAALLNVEDLAEAEA